MATASDTKAETHDGHDDDHDHHPSDKTYWWVGFGLAILTALEVSTYFRVGDDPYADSLGKLIIGALIVMMVIKFAVIGAFFMHLKFDNKIFRNLFVTGIVLALVVYGIVFFAFEYFDDGYEGISMGRFGGL